MTRIYSTPYSVYFLYHHRRIYLKQWENASQITLKIKCLHDIFSHAPHVCAMKESLLINLGTLILIKDLWFWELLSQFNLQLNTCVKISRFIYLLFVVDVSLRANETFVLFWSTLRPYTKWTYINKTNL